MIKRNRAWIAALLLLALPACNDDAWLTEVPQDFIGPENFFRNADDALAAINGAYRGFMTPLDCGVDLYYGRNFMMLVEYPGPTVTSRYGATHDRGGIDALNITVDHPYIAGTWQCAYSAIGSANLVIANVPNITNMDATLRDRIVAEGRFLRAIHYFNLVRVFGDVPLRLEPVTSVGNLALARSPASEVYAAIIADLEFAAQNLPARYTAAGDVGRATRGAAQTLLAKVHLQFGKVHGGGTASYNAAINAARQVIQSGEYRLLSDFGRIFALDNEMNEEVIFAIQNIRVLGLGGRMGQQIAPLLSGLNGTQVPNMSFYPEWPFYRDWPEQDSRKAATFLTTYTHPTHGVLTWSRPRAGTAAEINTFLNNFGAPNGGPVFRKYMDPNGLGGGNGDENDMILLRYADVLLMLAEAINEADGPTGEAYDAVNAVRARAYGAANPLPAGLSQEQFRNAVHTEREYELVLEGHTYFDMQRNWEWYKERIEANMLAGRPVNQGGQGLNAAPWQNSVPKIGLSGGIVEDKYRFFPIPTAARQVNPQLTQNPGW